MLPSLRKTAAAATVDGTALRICLRCSSTSARPAAAAVAAAEDPVTVCNSSSLLSPRAQLLQRLTSPSTRTGRRTFVSSGPASQRRTSARAVASHTIHAPPDAIGKSCSSHAQHPQRAFRFAGRPRTNRSSLLSTARDLEQLLPTLTPSSPPSTSTSTSSPPAAPAPHAASHQPARDALIVVTPALAHLLDFRDSSDFLARAVGHIFRDKDASSHVCAVCAVVDALPGTSDAEGVSVLALNHPAAVESVFGIHPDLSNAGSAPGGLLSFHVRDETPADSPSALTVVDVPTANTVFENGRRSTLHWSRWAVAPAGNASARLVHSQDVVRAEVKLTQIPALAQDFTITGELVPITDLRRISDGVGNVLRRLDVNGQSTPASRELEGAVPKLLSEWKKSAANIGVWALLLPSETLDGTPLETYEAVSAHFGVTLQTTDGYNGIEPGQLARMVAKGARILKVLSGGGGWGPKQGLLSLDPDYYLDYTSREVFVADDWAEQRGAAWGSIASPGSWVQFLASDSEQNSAQTVSPADGIATTLVFGALKKDQDAVRQSSNKEDAQTVDGVFGLSSQNGVGLRYKPDLTASTITSKIDMPGSNITISLRERLAPLKEKEPSKID